ncbi:hypothetical protein SAMN02745181_0076 [Rubritalea squalenifaciens DSM 18772]|uniref:Uncharacterized protein n=2 Tax=Rubritalea TaxID=361050 RepID=A0A1M6AZ15_9BACT|nr:hypothetical protein [Rubritalea squalenifaciens]SHI41710.1 hypothetical protein SAMN02745181_0076 [Rubritalea squalenifaciens DSM 18772]
MYASEIAPQHLATDQVQYGTVNAALDARYCQSVRIGCIEMERITEEIIIPQFEEIGAMLLKNGFDAELVIFDSESPIKSEVFLCGAGLRIHKGEATHAIVYTGDPFKFEFNLQTHNHLGETSEYDMQYHTLNPSQLYKRLLGFLEESFKDVNFASLRDLTNDSWQTYEGPFTVKLDIGNGNFTILATAESIDEASRLASLYCKSSPCEDKIILFDNTGRKVC